MCFFTLFFAQLHLEHFQNFFALPFLHNFQAWHVKRDKSHRLAERCSQIRTYPAGLYLHFCDPVILSNGTECAKEGMSNRFLRIYLPDDS